MRAQRTDVQKAEELHALFRDKLRFNSTIFELDIKSEKRPQLQLEQAVVNFKYENDGQHARKNLLIVFYTGHGFIVQDKPNDLIISGYVSCLWASSRDFANAR